MSIRFNRIFFGFILSIRCGRGITQDETDETATPRFPHVHVFVLSQTAQKCKLLKKESGSGSKVSQFQLKSFNLSAISFSNHPVYTAATMDTVVAVHVHVSIFCIFVYLSRNTCLTALSPHIASVFSLSNFVSSHFCICRIPDWTKLNRKRTHEFLHACI